MNFTTKIEGGIVYLGLSGEFSIEGSLEFKKIKKDLFKRQFNKIVLNLAELEFISSVGIRELLQINKETQDDGGKMIMVSMPYLIQNIIDSAGLISLFEICDNEEDAASLL